MRAEPLQKEIDNVEYFSNISLECSESFYESTDNDKKLGISVKSNLKRNISFWRDQLHANPFIESVIIEGYKIPFYSQPTPIICKNNSSALKHSKFVDKAVNELLEKCFIKEMNTEPICTNPLNVSVNSSGKERLILDLRHVNQFIHKFKVKFEGAVRKHLIFVNQGKKCLNLI